MALKTLEEINRGYILERLSGYSDNSDESTKPISLTSFETEFTEADEPAPAEESAAQANDKKRGTSAIISDILFYITITMVLFSALASGSGETPRVMMGYSYLSVLSSSMQDEIPKGSLILVKQIDPQALQEGDNITYMRDRSTSVTHKIIGIYENYQNSGARGFQTKGVNNSSPDEDIVYESNVVGKVILAVPAMGAAISWLGANIYIVFIIFGLCMILSFCVRGLFVNPEGKQEHKKLRFGKAAVTEILSDARTKYKEIAAFLNKIYQRRWREWLDGISRKRNCG